MKLAKKNKPKLAIRDQEASKKPKKKESFFDWLSRVSQNESHLKSSIELIKRELRDIRLIMQSMRRDGVLSDTVEDVVLDAGERHIRILDSVYDAILRRRQAATEHESKRVHAEKEKGVGNETEN